MVGTLERATNALLWPNDMEVELGGRHKSKILWLSHRRVGPRRCPGSRWSLAPGTRAPVEHDCAPDCALYCLPDLVQVAVGAEPRAAGSAGRELGEPRLGLVEGQQQTRRRASGTNGLG